MKKGYLFICLAALLFSTMEIALKLFSVGLNPIQLNFLRFTVGAVFLLPLALRSLGKRGRLGFRDLGFFAFAGFVCVVLSMTLYQLAVVRSRASVVAAIFSCNPVFVLPFAALFLGERVTGRALEAIAASVAGIACIAAPAFTGAVGGAPDPAGMLLTVLSALTFALYGVIGKSRSARYGSEANACLSFAAGAAELFILMLVSHIAPVADALRAAGLGVFADIPVLSGFKPDMLPGFLYIAVCVTGAGYLFWFLGMEHTSAQTGSIVFFIKPALAPVLAALVLGDRLGPNMLAGMAFIIAGSALMLMKRASRAPAPGNRPRP